MIETIKRTEPGNEKNPGSVILSDFLPKLFLRRFLPPACEIEDSGNQKRHKAG